MQVFHRAAHNKSTVMKERLIYIKKLGKQTAILPSTPIICASAAVVGKKEGEGPLKERFDVISEDSYFGQSSWEKAEIHMLRHCCMLACEKAGIPLGKLDYIFSGDLLNQCISSAFAMKDSSAPYLGLYGACSTMAESLALSAMLVDGGFGNNICAMTGSHFCTAERQYRFPLEYGGQRPPTSQWTVTGAGAAIVRNFGSGIKVSHVTVGRIVDAGINDANSMGSAMAPAAYETLTAHFADTGRSPEYYDAIFTGDLGALGHDILEKLFEQDGIKLGPRYMDCGVLIYDLATQNVFSGGSGCGCSASVLCGHILQAMRDGVWKKVLFAATGALMSPTSAQQGETIPGICHAVALEAGDE